MILTTRFVYPIHAVRDYYRFARAGFQYLLRNFKILELTEEAQTLETMGILLQRIGVQCETLGWRPFRLFWLLLARLVSIFSFVITTEYAESANKNITSQIFTSGYYVVCIKVDISNS